jgi:hypothetical protein
MPIQKEKSRHLGFVLGVAVDCSIVLAQRSHMCSCSCSWRSVIGGYFLPQATSYVPSRPPSYLGNAILRPTHTNLDRNSGFAIGSFHAGGLCHAFLPASLDSPPSAPRLNTFLASREAEPIRVTTNNTNETKYRCDACLSS